MPSGDFIAASEDNPLDIFGLSCLVNTCYDEIKNTIALVKQRIQGDQDPPYSLFEDGLMNRSGTSVGRITGQVTP